VTDRTPGEMDGPRPIGGAPAPLGAAAPLPADAGPQPPGPPRRRFRLLRRLLAGLGVLVLVLAGLGVAGFFFLGRFDLGPLLARGGTAALGRQVTVASLHVTPGRWLRVEVAGLQIDNLPGGTRPKMLELGQARLEVEALSLLRGPVAIRAAWAEDVSVLLERLPDRAANWHFGGDAQASAAPVDPAAPPDRSWFPSLRDVELRRGEVLMRTTGGQMLRTRLETASLQTAGDDQPVRLEGAGAYNDTAVTLAASLDPIAVLRDATRPYGTDLHLVGEGDTALDFKGTMTVPLDIDGAHGTLSLTAPKLDTLLKLSGAAMAVPAPIVLAGRLDRSGSLWRLTEASGSLAGEALTVKLLQLAEGGAGEPDAITLDLALDKLDLDALLPDQGGAPRGDTPLVLSQRPDPALDVRLRIGALAYDGVRANELELVGTQTPGRIDVPTLALTTSGIRLNGSGEAAATETGARITAAAALEQSDLDDVRKILGLRSVPMSGRLDGRIAVTAEADTLEAVTRVARVQAVVSMRGGRIAKSAIEMASTDMRALFRDASGTTPIACLLAVAQMDGQRGTVAPLRVRAETGTITGRASFDLGAQRLDLVIGSQRDTTGFFALDVPVRVSGSFASPDILPAEWSAEGRAQLAAGDDMAPLPPDLRSFAQRSACYRQGSR